MLTNEENSGSILFHKGLHCLHDATVCERVSGSTEKKKENKIFTSLKRLMHSWNSPDLWC